MAIFQSISENPDEEFDIQFEIADGTDLKEMNLMEEELYKNIESTAIVIKSLKHTKIEIKRKYFNKLLSLARVGFLGESPQYKLAQKYLESLKHEILMVEGQRIKSRYMHLLGVGAVISIAACWVLYWILSLITEISALDRYFFVWSGAMIGAWISFGARKTTFQLDDLSVLEKDNMDIYIRLPYIGLCALVFLLLLDSNIFSFEIGNISSDKIDDSVEIQLLIGVIAGLLESKLGSNIYEKIQGLTIK